MAGQGVSIEIAPVSIKALSDLQKNLRGVSKQVRQGARRQIAVRMRKEVAPLLRADARKRARAMLPGKRHGARGYGAWVAKARGSVTVKYTGRWAGIRFRMSRRNKSGAQADLMRADRGRIRHPMWGRWSRRSQIQSLQDVAPGWFSGIDKTAVEAARTVAVSILDDAAKTLRSKR